MFPTSVPALSPEPTLTAAMAEVEAFARREIIQPIFWQPFVATGGGQRVHGFWQLTKRLGPQAILLSMNESEGSVETLWVARPTGLLVLSGTCLVTIVGSGPVAERVYREGEPITITQPIKCSIEPMEGETCSFLVTRLHAFPGTPPERMMSHRISAMDRADSDALYGRMRKLILG